MPDVSAVTTIVGSVVGVLGGITGVVSLVNQRRQTEIMEKGLERAFDVPEGETGKGFERKIRAIITRRLTETRAKMKQDFDARLYQIEQELKADHITEYKHILLNLSESLRDGKTISDLAEDAKRIRGEIQVTQEHIQAETGRNSGDIAIQGREIEGLHQLVEDMRKGIEFHDSVLTQIRLIAEQLVKIASPGEKISQSQVIDQDEGASQRQTLGGDKLMRPDDLAVQEETANESETRGDDGPPY